ncbi:glycosyltransferase family 2 protein [Ruegeria sp. Ofav3-42]|uniref:glycosyltransferase family 2 protein n=1 Tax=Ruegeria sp. Ofav3-42 TaxID=2917759 RepID=UPI001EF6D19B|nr:glycosyltransferase family 2 protein [Ruegeria sp. Ofav3-42]MCG7519239.1 glycosyltransferase [Ruegeria sp. Ofav3-42]
MSASPDKTDAPLISVITATYNLLSQGRQDSFREVIDCMARQGCARAEHIIQDGASTDGTVEFLQELTADAPRTRLISEPDSGLYDAMNKGAQAACGEYLLFLNSDDSLASDDILSTVADRLEAAQPDFLYGSTLRRYEDGSETREKRMSLTAILQRMPFCHNSVLLKRDVFLALGGHDTQFRVAADYDLMLRLLTEGYQGERTDEPISMFWGRGVTSDIVITAEDYARVWMKYYDGFKAAQDLTQEDFFRFFRRGHMPVPLILERLSKPGTSDAIKAAARHSLWKTMRRSVQFWRSF